MGEYVSNFVTFCVGGVRANHSRHYQFIFCSSSSSSTGIISTMSSISVNISITQKLANTQQLIMSAADWQLHVTNKSLPNIRLIEILTWDLELRMKVGIERKVERKVERVF